MDQEKVLVITYYWPPSGGSGVQRWMYFCKYLPANGVLPFVITVDPKKASYKFADESFSKHVESIPVFYTNTFEPLRLYSRMTTGSVSEGIPQGFAGESKPGLFKKLARYARGNWFIPDARKGWNKFALRKAEEILKREGIKKIITTGPPHSTHLVGLALKKKYNVKWIADFRDPWTELYYNRFLYRTASTRQKDTNLEKKVLDNCDRVLTIGPSMRELLASKIADGSRTSFIYNGYDSDMFALVKKIPEGNPFIISHIGVLGESQPITAFLEALNRVFAGDKPGASDLVLQITGKVSPVIEEDIRKRCPWLHVRFNPYVKHHEAIEQMCASHMLFNSLAETENARYLISGKLMEYIASGNPVLCLGDPEGDAARLLGDYFLCAVYSRDDVSGIAAQFSIIYKRWVNRENIRHNASSLPFSRKNTAAELAELIYSMSE